MVAAHIARRVTRPSAHLPLLFLASARQTVRPSRPQARRAIGGGLFGQRKTPLAPLVLPAQGFDVLDPDKPLEEERMPFYNPEAFYPVRLGEVFSGQYQVVSKIGYGVTSTVWLGLDLVNHRYVMLKVHMNTIQNSRELRVYEQLNDIAGPEALKQLHIRPLEDCFSVAGPCGEHLVFVQPVLAADLGSVKHRKPDGVLDESEVRAALRQILPALDFLHSQADVTHTDVHENNIMVAMEDEQVFRMVEEAEMNGPAPRKITADRTIYRSRTLMGATGPLYLCDFGEARIGLPQHGPAMPATCRAPEVVLGMAWGHEIDMWGVGVMVWDMLEPERLFGDHDADTDPAHSDACHLAEMVALLGPPPPALRQRSHASLEFWDEDGNWRGPVPIPESRTMASLGKHLDERPQMKQFVLDLLRWSPEERLTAKQAMDHAWLAE